MPEPSATRLVDLYREVLRLTVALRESVDADQLDRLDALADERAAALTAAARDLAALTRGGTPIAPPDADAIRGLLGAAAAEDERLRALVASRVQALPRQMAELRGARAGLGGYQASAADSSDLVDRRG